MATPQAPSDLKLAGCPCGSGVPFIACHGGGKPASLVPTAAPTTVTRRLDLACGQSPREGFEGVDRWSGAQHCMNLWKFPWPFEDSSVLELHCSHFVEHIPMIEVDSRGEVVPYGEGVDLFLRFFDECYRILAPEGWITVIAPCARNDRAFQDPTHRRFITAQTFQYLSAEWRHVNRLDHYGVSCDFGGVGGGVNPTVSTELMTRNPTAAQRMMTHEWNHILDWVAKLKVSKPAWKPPAKS